MCKFIARETYDKKFKFIMTKNKEMLLKWRHRVCDSYIDSLCNPNSLRYYRKWSFLKNGNRNLQEILRIDYEFNLYHCFKNICA